MTTINILGRQWTTLGDNLLDFGVTTEAVEELRNHGVMMEDQITEGNSMSLMSSLRHPKRIVMMMKGTFQPNLAWDKLEEEIGKLTLEDGNKIIAMVAPLFFVRFLKNLFGSQNISADFQSFVENLSAATETDKEQEQDYGNT